MRRSLLFLVTLAAWAQACSGADSLVESDAAARATDGGTAGASRGHSDGGSGAGDTSAAIDSGPKTPPLAPGFSYAKRGSFTNYSAIHFYDPTTGASTLLADARSDHILRSKRLGPAFAYLYGPPNDRDEIFEGFFGPGGVAKRTHKLVSKSSASPFILLAVGDDDGVYYSGEIDQRGYCDWYRNGARISQGPGREEARPGNFMQFVDAIGGSVAWQTTLGDDKLFVRWAGEPTEIELDAYEPSLSFADGDVMALSPTGRCLSFPTTNKVDAASLSPDLGVRCKGDAATTALRLPGQRILSPTATRLQWHPTLDRFAGYAPGELDSRTLFFGERSPTGWTIVTVPLPAGLRGVRNVSLTRDGSHAFVVGSDGQRDALFVAPFGDPALPTALIPIPLGADVELRALDAGIGGHLAVWRKPNNAPPPGQADIVFVAPDGVVVPSLATTDPIVGFAWSPDGARLAVRTSLPAAPPARPNAIGEVKVLSAATGAIENFTPAGAIVRDLVWSGASDSLGVLADVNSVPSTLLGVSMVGGAASATPIDTDVLELIAVHFPHR